MELVSLGNSGLAVSRLGLGLAALGRPGYINLGHAHDMAGQYEVGDLARRTHEVLDSAWRAGIRYFDAARSYGRAEQFLASWLTDRAIDPDEVTIGSKWGYTYTADWQIDAEVHEVKEHSLPVLQEQAQLSYELFGQHLNLYQIHSVSRDSGALDDLLLLSELARMRENGLVIGLTVSGPEQAEMVRQALEIRFDGVCLFGAVQATWNLLETSVSPALAEAHDAGLGVLVKEVLANGRLTPRGQAPGLNPHYDLLAEAAAGRNTTVDALATAAALAQPWSHTVLSGAATVAQLHSHLGALQVSWSESVAERLAPLQEPPERYWSQRSQLPWN